MKRSLWLGFVVLLFLICVGCGDTFRPIIIPNPPTFPNPKAAHTAVAITANGADSDAGNVNNGAAMVVDVTGDSTVSVKDVDIRPVNAVQLNAQQVLVVNQAVTGLNPPASGCLVNVVGPPPRVYNVCPSITKLQFSGVAINNTTTITLPPSSAANFITGAPLDTTAYVSLPHYIPVNAPPFTVVPSVGVVNVTNNVVTNFIAVGNNPVALAVTPDKSKLYVANHDDSTVGGFNTIDRSQRTGSPTATTAAPIWLVPRTDNQRLYILEESGELAQMDTTSTAGPDLLTEFPGITVAGANAMTYDPNKNRLYIPGGSVADVVDVSQSAPQILAQINIAPVLPSSRPQGDVCSTFTPGSVKAVAAAALPDASRAYIGAYSAFEVDVNISKAVLDSDNIHTSYTYSVQPPGTIDLLPGMVITISGVISSGKPPSDFNGTFEIVSVGGGTFQVANKPTDTYLSGGTGAAPNVCPQVTVVDVPSNTIKSTIVVPGVPAYNAACSSTRFRMMMAAGGDSSRVYLSSCDGGNVNIIDTTVDKYIENLPAPTSARAPIPPSTENPPQNPVFLIAGP